MKIWAQLIIAALLLGCGGLFKERRSRLGKEPDRYELEVAAIMIGKRGKTVGPQRIAVGDRVKARWTDRKLYPGKVVAVHQQTVDVDFDDGDKLRDVPQHDVFRYPASRKGLIDCNKESDPELAAFCKLDCQSIANLDLRAHCAYDCEGIKNTDFSGFCKIHHAMTRVGADPDPNKRYCANIKDINVMTICIELVAATAAQQKRSRSADSPAERSPGEACKPAGATVEYGDECCGSSVMHESGHGHECR